MRRGDTSRTLVLVVSGMASALMPVTAQGQSAPAQAGGMASPSISPFPSRTDLPIPLFSSATGPTATSTVSPPLVSFGLTAEEQGTDNVFSTATKLKADLVSTVKPSASIDYNSKRLQVNATYDLSYNKYLFNSSLDGLTFGGLGVADAEVINHSLFLDSRLAVTERDASSTGPTTAGTRTAASNRTQVTTYSITPRLEQHLGHWAIGQVSYSHDESIASTPSSTTNASRSLQQTSLTNGGTNGSNGSNSSSGNDGKVTLRSGEAFSRLQWIYTGDISRRSEGIGNATKSTASTANGTTGSNLMNNVTQSFGVEYKINNDVSLLAETGIDDAHGSQINNKINGVYYNAGLHWTPSPNTDVRGGYGSRYGTNNLFLLGEHWFGPKTLFRISRSSGLSSDSLSFVEALNAVQRDPSGTFVDPFSGGAAQPGAASPTISNATYRQDTTQAFISRRGDRETVTLSGQLVEQQVVGGVAPNQTVIPGTTLGTSSKTLSLSLSWSHSFSPLTTLTSSLSWNEVLASSSASGKGQRTQAQVTLNQQLGKTLSGYLTYGYTESNQPSIANSLVSFSAVNNQSVGKIVDNSVVVGLRKQF